MNLGSMSSDLVQLQKLRTQIAEAKAKKEMGKDISQINIELKLME